MRFLKRIICVALAVMAITAFVACDKQEAVDTQTASNNGEKSNKAGISYYIEFKGQKVQMGADADPIIEAIGEYQDRKEIGDCGGLGAQVKYSYAAVEIFVLESKEKGNVIDQITFRTDAITTPEGVYIGMDTAQAKEILGEPTSESQTAFEYAGDKYVLVITVADGKVNKIDYMTV